MIKEWVLTKLLKGRIVLFDDGKAIHRINDIYPIRAILVKGKRILKKEALG